MPKVRANGLSLHYITVGCGPDVVMVHGLLGNLAVWHLYLAPILQREFRITTYDLRGHGYSEAPPAHYTAADMAEDLRLLLQELGIDRPMLVGHGFGADICMYFSLLYPERVPKLVALDPGLTALAHIQGDRRWIGWRAWIARMEELGLQPTSARGLPGNRASWLHLIRHTTLMKDCEDAGALTTAALRTIRTPTLLVNGSDSQWIGSYEYLRHTLSNVKPILLPGGAHFGPLEQPEVLSNQMLDFLRNEAIVRSIRGTPDEYTQGPFRPPR